MSKEPDGLDPIEPDDAMRLYLDYKETEFSKNTLYAQRYRLQYFVQRCDEIGLSTCIASSSKLGDSYTRVVNANRLYHRGDKILRQIQISGTFGRGATTERERVSGKSLSNWSKRESPQGSAFGFIPHGRYIKREMEASLSQRPIDILLVEDNPSDARLTKEAFKSARLRNDLNVVTNGKEALDYLHQRGEYKNADRPDIILLDLNLPGVNGPEILEDIKTTEELKLIPVVILTSSTAEEDVVESYDKYASAYLTKPVDADEFVNLARSFREFWGEQARLPPAGG